MSLAGLEYEAKVHGDRIRTQLHFLLGSSGSSSSSEVKTEGSPAPAAAGSKASKHFANARKHLDAAISGSGSAASSSSSEMEPRVAALESENARMAAELKELKAVVASLSAKLSNASLSNGPAKSAPSAAAAAKKEASEDEDSDPDLFGSDEEEEEDEEKAARKAKLLEAYAAKKAKKPGPIAKSSVIFDVKPWEAETDMGAMEAAVRGIAMEGLVWGAAKLIPVAYGVKKLQIMSTVEDEKVSVDSLQEQIEAFEDYVQSVDIAAFNKI